MFQSNQDHNKSITPVSSNTSAKKYKFRKLADVVDPFIGLKENLFNYETTDSVDQNQINRSTNKKAYSSASSYNPMLGSTFSKPQFNYDPGLSSAKVPNVGTNTQTSSTTSNYNPMLKSTFSKPQLNYDAVRSSTKVPKIGSNAPTSSTLNCNEVLGSTFLKPQRNFDPVLSSTKVPNIGTNSPSSSTLNYNQVLGSTFSKPQCNFDPVLFSTKVPNVGINTPSSSTLNYNQVIGSTFSKLQCNYDDPRVLSLSKVQKIDNTNTPTEKDERSSNTSGKKYKFRKLADVADPFIGLKKNLFNYESTDMVDQVKTPTSSVYSSKSSYNQGLGSTYSKPECTYDSVVLPSKVPKISTDTPTSSTSNYKPVFGSTYSKPQCNYDPVILSPPNVPTTDYNTSTETNENSDAANFRSLFAEDNSIEFSNRSYSHTIEMEHVFREVFGLNKFRHKQLPAINAALLGHDCFILMPTGAGKSLCYQLPGIMSRGITVVISPLRSLIEDQVSKLKKWNIEAAGLTGETSDTESAWIHGQLRCLEPELKLLYVTPEKVTQSARLIGDFELMNKNKLLARFIVDEAHCVSQWGHDFRPDYKRLSMLKEKFPNVPILALTATATPRTVLDTQKQLNIPNSKFFVSSFCRSNLSYSIRKKSKQSIRDMIQMIKSDFNKQSGIIYCLSRKECEEMATNLSQSGISASAYHAGLADKKRTSVQRDWISGKVKVICATIAFGMGIDKPNVRFVIHFSIAKSIEGYYQETGRAGRDGQPSKCILMYTYNDVVRIRRLLALERPEANAMNMHIENLMGMLKYCENINICRRKFLVEYFGEIYDSAQCKADRKSTCDICSSNVSCSLIDLTDDTKTLITTLRIFSSRRRDETLHNLADIYRGANTTRLKSRPEEKSCSLYGKGICFSADEAQRFVKHLIIERVLEEYLKVSFQDNMSAYLKLGPEAQKVVDGSKRIAVHFPVKKGTSHNAGKEQMSEVTAAIESNRSNSDISEECFNALSALIFQIEEEEGLNTCSTDVIMSNEGLQQIAGWLPRTESDLLKIDTMTKAKVQKYGSRIMQVLKPYWERIDQREAAKMERELNAFQSSASSSRSPMFGALNTSRGSGGSGTRSSNGGSQSYRKFARKKFGKRKKYSNPSGQRFPFQTAAGVRKKTLFKDPVVHFD